MRQFPVSWFVGIWLTGTEDALPILTGDTGDAQFHTIATTVPTWAKSLADQFLELAEWWERKTMFPSNLEQTVALSSYAAIVRLGVRVVPLIMRRMRAQGGYWQGDYIKFGYWPRPSSQHR